MLPPQYVSDESPPQVPASLGRRRWSLADGSNSSGTHSTRAEAGSRRKENAKAEDIAVVSIMRCVDLVPAQVNARCAKE